MIKYIMIKEVLDKDPRGSKVLERYVLVSNSEKEAEKKNLIMKIKEVDVSLCMKITHFEKDHSETWCI